jgi:hypothetical protein
MFEQNRVSSATTSRSFFTAVVAIAVILTCSIPAFAQNTAVTLGSGAGISLPYFGATAIDPAMQVSRDGGATWMPAYAGNDPWGDTPFIGAHWVQALPQFQGNPEPMRFRISFFVPAGISNPSLTGTIWADDQTAAIVLNGTAILTLPSGAAVYPVGSGQQPFATTNASLFKCGTNVLEFDTVNLGGVGGMAFTAQLSYDGGSATACDTTAPLVSVPAAISVDATSAAGAAVTFAATATDPDDAAGPVSCSSASGSTFPIGTTTVMCTSADTFGNTGSAAFTITVRGAGQQLNALAAQVVGAGPGKSFSSQVSDVQKALAAGDQAGACAALNALTDHIRAQSGKQITVALANTLLAAASRIGAVIGC